MDYSYIKFPSTHPESPFSWESRRGDKLTLAEVCQLEVHIRKLGRAHNIHVPQELITAYNAILSRPDCVVCETPEFAEFGTPLMTFVPAWHWRKLHQSEKIKKLVNLRYNTTSGKTSEFIVDKFSLIPVPVY